MSWEDICKDKSEGGLGIRDIGMFNSALVGKWVWKFLEKKESLWVQVVESRYGSFGREVRGGGLARASIWWRDLCRLYWGSEGEGLRREFVRREGRGDTTLFWEDEWAIGGESLRDKFPRLFRISVQKTGRISEMGRWEHGEWKWELEWCRSVSRRNLESLNALMLLLNRIHLKENEADFWSWQHAANGIYSTNLAYQRRRKLRSMSSEGEEFKRKVFRRLWKSWAIIKAIPTAWKLLKGRVATKENLMKRGVHLNDEEKKCCLCKEEMETVSHLFFSCKFACSIWENIIS